MPQNLNKVEWCLRKAEKEGRKHRGLVKIAPDLGLVNSHLKKAEHNLKAIGDFQSMGYADWSPIAAFYSVYHCFLAILAKHGYESKNQECTFALIDYLIEIGQLNFPAGLIEQVYNMKPEAQNESLLIELREFEQYGVSTSADVQLIAKLIKFSREIMDRTKEALS